MSTRQLTSLISGPQCIHTTIHNSTQKTITLLLFHPHRKKCLKLTYVRIQTEFHIANSIIPHLSPRISRNIQQKNRPKIWFIK